MRRINGRPQTVEYRASVPADSWMPSQTASIRVVTDTCRLRRARPRPGNPFLLCLNPAPKMRSVFTPRRSLPSPSRPTKGSARVQFHEVDRTELHAEPHLCRNGQRIDNRAQLRIIIDDSVRYAFQPRRGDRLYRRCGYASPESPYLHNEFLSTQPVPAHPAEYLGAKYNLPADRSTYSSVAEN